MLPVVLTAVVAALIFACGLLCRTEDVLWLWRRPRLLLRSAAAMYVAVPLAAVAMVSLLELRPAVEAALLFFSISAGAPLLSKKLLKLGGDPAYAFSLIVTTSLLAIVTVPASVALLGPLMPSGTQVDALDVAILILKSILLPFAAGMGIRALATTLAERIGDPLMKAGGLALVGCLVVVVVGGWRLFVEAGLDAILAFAILTGAALLAGHALGGPRPEQRTVLAVSCASRHVGLALLVAAHVRGPGALTLVAGYLLAAALVSVPYLMWQRRAGALG